MPGIPTMRSRYPRSDGAIGLALRVLACLLASAAWADEHPPALEPSSTVAVQLAAGEHRRYRIVLGPGRSALLSIRQNDAMLHLRWAEANQLLSAPLFTQAGRQAWLHWHFDADATREWIIDIAAAKKDRAATLHLQLGAEHATRADDRLASSAERAFAAAETIRVAAGGVEPGRQPADVAAARAGYASAAARWRRAGMRCSAIVAQVGLARLELALARYPQAQSAAESALGDCSTTDPATRADRAAALRTLASALGYQGDFEGAADHAERALALYRRTGDRRFEGVVLGNLSADYRSIGETQRATISAQAALDIALATGDAQGVEFSRDNLADSHLARGEFGRALAIYRQTLDDLRTTPYPLTEGLVWNELGTLYRRMGQADAASDAWTHAREIWAHSGNRSGLAQTWIAMGDAALDDGAAAHAAAAFVRALDIARADRLRSPELHALRGLAGVATAAGDTLLARQQLTTSLQLADELDDRAGLLAGEQAFGDLEARAGHWPEARARYRTALAAALRSGDASAEAAARASLARVESAQGDLDGARTDIERALSRVESQRAQIADPGLRTGFFASQHAYYALAIEIEMALEARSPDSGHRERALEIAERARARSLQDTLAERGIDVSDGVDPALLAAERQADDTQRRLAYRAARGESLLTATARAQLNGQIKRAERELDAARGRIRSANQRYADIAHPLPPTTTDLRTRLLDAHTAVLEYWIGESNSYLWIVERDRVRSVVLPSRAVIANAAQTLYDHVLVRSIDDSSVSIERHVALDARAGSAIREQALALADLVLPGDVRTSNAHTWAIVADDALQDVPFALLLDAVFGADAPAIVQLPSVGTLQALRALPPPATPGQVLTIVADPVFAHNDPRLASTVESIASPMATAARRVASAEVADLPLLPQARAEADDLLALADPRPTRTLRGFDATRDAVLHADWSDVAIVHFATHARVDARDPQLSGIVLSLYDAAGRPQDGFLRIDDLYTLDLPADLVVLGVCDAATGGQVVGEGVQSLARAFFHAGTRHILGSLWPVDDRASAVFMHAFYVALLRQGLRPQAALQAAQSQMRQTPRWSAPYYWSGFVVQGDWR